LHGLRNSVKRFRVPARAARLYDRAVGGHLAIKSVGQDLLDRRLDRLGKADVFEGERDAAQSVPIYGVKVPPLSATSHPAWGRHARSFTQKLDCHPRHP
jgi:hypothetical protein